MRGSPEIERLREGEGEREGGERELGKRAGKERRREGSISNSLVRLFRKRHIVFRGNHSIYKVTDSM